MAVSGKSKKRNVGVEPVPQPDPERLQQAMLVVMRGPRAEWWRRRGTKNRGFRYEDAQGRRVTDKAALDRVAKLVLPPGWLEVRVNPKAGGRLQAIGIDASGRVQYRYHAAFSAGRQKRKFSRLLKFGERLPRLREKANRDVAGTAFNRERVLAIVTRLINDLYFRLGSDESVRRYKTFGLTTLRNRHVRIESGGKLVFDFVGKHHIRHRRVLIDEDLAALLQELKAIGGSRLFHYFDANGALRRVRPSEVNRYIKEAMGFDFSAKDFRTWHGTLLAAEGLAARGPADSERGARKVLTSAVKRVAVELGNTPTVCRNCYIHPAVLESYQRGVTLDEFRRSGKRVIRLRQSAYEPEEQALLRLLKQYEKSGRQGSAPKKKSSPQKRK